MVNMRECGWNSYSGIFRHGSTWGCSGSLHCQKLDIEEHNISSFYEEQSRERERDPKATQERVGQKFQLGLHQQKFWSHQYHFNSLSRKKFQCPYGTTWVPTAHPCRPSMFWTIQMCQWHFCKFESFFFLTQQIWAVQNTWMAWMHGRVPRQQYPTSTEKFLLKV